jgi:predicted nucleic acid-binding protein
MSARSLNFDDTLPPTKIIYADSSFILNLVSSISSITAQFQIDCESFLKRLQNEDFCLVTSDFAIDEVCFNIIKAGFQRNIPFKDSAKGINYKKWDHLAKDKSELIQVFLPRINRFFDYIDAIPFLIVSYPELKDLSEELYLQVKNRIASYNLLPADAYHISIGKSVGINDFVAVDTDWFRVDDINLYTCLPNP